MLFLEFQALIHQMQLVYSTSWECLLWLCDMKTQYRVREKGQPRHPYTKAGLSALLSWPEEVQPTEYETTNELTRIMYILD